MPILTSWRVVFGRRFLSNGTFSISYFPNGCVNSFGYHRMVKNVQGEQDGLCITYDNTGNLFSETKES